MTNNLKKYTLSLILVVVLVCALTIGIVGRSAVPAFCANAEKPTSTVGAYFTALCDGRYDDCGKLTAGHKGFSFESGAVDESTVSGSDLFSSMIKKRLYEELTTGYSYELIGELRSQSGKNSFVQTVELTHLDLMPISKELNACLRAILTDMERFEDIRDNDNVYLDSAVGEALTKAFDTVLADPSKYMTVSRFDVPLTYEEGQWKLVVTPEMESAIIGESKEAE